MQHTFNVTGMTCGHCEKAVSRALQSRDPQAVVVIDRNQNRVAECLFFGQCQNIDAG